MRCGYLVLFVAGCGFHSSAGAPDAPLPVPDGGMPVTQSLGANEFKAGELVDMTFDAARGSLTPSAYTYGGLIAHGVAGMKLWDHGNTAWSNLDPVTVSGAGLWRGESFTSADRIDQFGVTNSPAMVTLWFEGEVWLTAGSNETFSLQGNDVAFFQLASPGKAAFGPATESGTDPVSVAVPTTGWYPIRLGFADGNGSGSFVFQHSDSAATPVPWTRDRLRARASELSGALRTVFFHQILGGGDVGKLPISHVDDGSLLLLTTFPDPALQGAPTSNDGWSARYAAQIYIPQTGSYTLKVTSDDGHELWFGGQTKNPNWDFNSGNANAMSTVMATLNAGWNDVIVDYNQFFGGRKLQVQLTGGGLTADIPYAQLRPVEPALDRLAFGSDDTMHNVQDNGGQGKPGTAVMNVDAYAGTAPEMVTSIDVTYEVVSPHWNELRFDLESPTKRVNIANGGGIPNGDSIGQTSIAAGTGGMQGMLLGGPASGTWKLHVYDVQDSGSGNVDSTLKSAKLTLHTMGGPDKVARTASWTSQPIDAMGDAFAIDGITWKARVPEGASVQVRLRGCQQANCSDVPAWSDPVTSGAQFPIKPAPYLQLRVEMTSDGSHEPELQSLEIKFRRALTVM